MPRCGGFASGSVLATTMKRSPIWPFEMKVLEPFEDVVVAVADRARLHVGQVRAGAGLGHGDAEQDLAGDAAGHPALLLLLGAVVPRYGTQMSACSENISGVGAQPASSSMMIAS
jgi:hypothetical protein